MSRLFVTAATILAAATLTACGGGGGSSGGSGNNAQTGHYKDAGSVAGLQYTTASQSGTTGTNGEFLYQPGETVTFSLGSIVIGQATAAANLTTFDLVGITPPTTGLGIPNNTSASLSFQQVANISVLLQTLDEDADASNGIQIPAQAANSATSNLSFRQSYEKFGNSWSLNQFIGNCRIAGLWGGSRAIKNTGYALNNLYTGLGLTANLKAQTGGTTNNSGTINSTTYAYNIGANTIVQTSSYGRTTYHFNDNGDMLESISYDTNNTVSYRNVYTYDPNGYQTSSMSYDSANVLQSQVDFTVNAFGQETVSQYYYSYNQNTDRWAYTWNNQGQRVSATHFINGVNSGYDQYIYSNLNTQPDRVNFYDANNTLTGYIVYTYNSNNDVLTYKSYTANGTVYYEYADVYDASGNVIQTTSQSTWSPSVYRSETSYNSDGYPTQRQSFTDQTLESTTTYTYDTEGYQTASTTSYPGGSSASTKSYTATSRWQSIFNSISYIFFN